MGDPDGFLRELGWRPYSRFLNSSSKKQSKLERPEEEEEPVYTFSFSWANMFVMRRPRKQVDKSHALLSRWAPYLHPRREQKMPWSSMEKELERYQERLLEIRNMHLDLEPVGHIHASPRDFLPEDHPAFSSQDQACEALDAFKRLSVSASTSAGPEEEGDLEDTDKSGPGDH